MPNNRLKKKIATWAFGWINWRTIKQATHHGRQGSDEIETVVDSIHSQLLESSGGILARSCSLSTGCQGGWMRVSNSLCPHFKIAPFLHSTSASSSFSSTSLNGWQSPGLMCPLLCRHWAKMQTHCETSLKILIWITLTRASRLFTRKDIAIQFPGVNLHGALIGFLVVFTFSSGVDCSSKRRLKYLLLSACHCVFSG